MSNKVEVVFIPKAGLQTLEVYNIYFPNLKMVIKNHQIQFQIETLNQFIIVSNQQKLHHSYK